VPCFFFDQLPLDWTVPHVLDTCRLPLLYISPLYPTHYTPVAQCCQQPMAILQPAGVLASMSDEHCTVCSICTYYRFLPSKRYVLTCYGFYFPNVYHVYQRPSKGSYRAAPLFAQNPTFSFSPLDFGVTLSSQLCPLPLPLIFLVLNTLPRRHADLPSESPSLSLSTFSPLKPRAP